MMLYPEARGLLLGKRFTVNLMILFNYIQLSLAFVLNWVNPVVSGDNYTNATLDITLSHDDLIWFDLTHHWLSFLEQQLFVKQNYLVIVFRYFLCVILLRNLISFGIKYHYQNGSVEPLSQNFYLNWISTESILIRIKTNLNSTRLFLASKK